jgi:hypothetical protein
MSVRNFPVFCREEAKPQMQRRKERRYPQEGRKG